MGGTLVPKVTTPPTAYPVSLAEVKAQLSLATDVDDDDARIAGLIATATRNVETYLGMALITRSYVGYLDHWPHRREGDHDHAEWPSTYGDAGGGFRLARSLEIPMPPLITVDAVTTFDDDDNPTVFDPSNYYVDTASFVGRLVLRRDACWPLACRAANGIEIAWTCGVGPTLRPFVDEDVRAAIIITVGALNEQRGDLPAPDLVPGAAKWCLPDRRTWL